MAPSEKRDLADNPKDTNTHDTKGTPHNPTPSPTRRVQAPSRLKPILLSLTFLLITLFALIYISYHYWDPLCMFTCQPLFGHRHHYNSSEPVRMCPYPAQGHEKEAWCREVYPNGTVVDFNMTDESGKLPL
ncbi:hypothetical protein HBH56_120680 [Parastagonospora nodorum]|uniref:Uncharacterized protein n=2 Tax=Phaeosphaeria nodorum (strain SN15 / ATCC MYA-4574 / FGSC 10173) TaxID=321614 RepID=Q0U355_PHANO|nr:hypothetical protein SNOG_13809 [Parastagonospora nodorum SN15]KAH3912026.1 hypothetical protein HBH56_120680 [Parastagonospora nodorum]EAT78833.1 hypothetical protein SNOG_13809 [Parastagonospora nodorum SN15]KAH3924307.1 hypothetical protein HBH54_196580 [Parastagonospora nodorum]KAH4046043.1 hypothetical protein HBH49_192640 [Parastagonospora nodorum]KAH4060215.1 hypothetical protein HBH50_223670 [Parastagonospora nodorum]